jgi:hypothetical protein
MLFEMNKAIFSNKVFKVLVFKQVETKVKQN